MKHIAMMLVLLAACGGTADQLPVHDQAQAALVDGDVQCQGADEMASYTWTQDGMQVDTTQCIWKCAAYKQGTVELDETMVTAHIIQRADHPVTITYSTAPAQCK